MTTNPTPAEASKESPAVRKKREELAAELEIQHKAGLAAKAKAAAEEAAAATARAIKALKAVTPENPLKLRRVDFNNALRFSDDATLTTMMVDLQNRQYEGTVLLFDGALVHVFTKDPAKSFVVPIANVAKLTPSRE